MSCVWGTKYLALVRMALLEGSKAWMKDVVHAAGVPTARYGFESSQVDRAIEFYRQ